ncbi:MAG: peptide deformylase [Deltaproteobacteria bacterium]|jgi:peptide deformylase|nr:peptide deformylase [Deltaproteobacteria bacterium]
MSSFTSDRRRFLVGAGAAALIGGCAGRVPTATEPGCPRAPVPEQKLSWLPAEQPLIAAQRPDFDVVTRGSAAARVLRSLARPVPAGADLEDVERRMEATMRAAGGVGIAGPQVGLSLRVATLMLDYKTDAPRILFVRNPVIVERSDETVEGYEGCLSVPDVGGLVRRHAWIRIEHQARDGEILTTEAEGYNAVLWQHELDHLDGVLYVDKLLGELMPMDEVRRLREEADRKARGEQPVPPATEESRRQGDCLEGASYLVA